MDIDDIKEEFGLSFKLDKGWGGTEIRGLEAAKISIELDRNKQLERIADYLADLVIKD